MSIVRWDEFATLTRPRPRTGEDVPARELIGEGTLAEVVNMLARVAMSARCDMLISMPDRRVPPNRYEAEDFYDLLLRNDRPKRA